MGSESIVQLASLKTSGIKVINTEANKIHWPADGNIEISEVKEKKQKAGGGQILGPWSPVTLAIVIIYQKT